MNSELRDAYFAGLIDGEGCLRLARKRANGIRPTIEVEMTCETTVTALQQNFGRGTVRVKKTRPGCKPSWVWTVYYYDAVEVAKRILPFSITKREHAEAIRDYVPNKRGRPKG